MDEVFIPIIAILSTSVMVVLIVYFVTTGRRQRLEAQVMMQSRLIERFSSASELVDFLHSSAGKEFVTGVTIAPEVLTRDRIMSGFSRAVVLICLGIAFLVLTFAYDRDWVIPAVIVLSIGIGYFLATFISYKLAEKFRAQNSERSSTL
jgi:hypothetical protein